MAGAPVDNQNAREGKRWREALKRALSRAASDIDSGLDKVAEGLVRAACAGKPWAIEHIAERMDGKATQVVHSTVEVTHQLGYAEHLAAGNPDSPGLPQRTVQ